MCRHTDQDARSSSGTSHPTLTLLEEESKHDGQWGWCQEILCAWNSKCKHRMRLFPMAWSNCLPNVVNQRTLQICHVKSSHFIVPTINLLVLLDLDQEQTCLNWAVW